MEWIWRKFLKIEWSGVDFEESSFIAKAQFTPKNPFCHHQLYTKSPKAWWSPVEVFIEWRIRGEWIRSGYGVDMEKIFENKMELSGFGLWMITWSGIGAKHLQREDLY